MQLVNENSQWDTSSIRTQFGEHIRSRVVVANHMMDFQPQELVLDLVYLLNVCVHGVLVDIPLLVDLLDHQ
jgi:hypothetical protein